MIEASSVAKKITSEEHNKRGVRLEFDIEHLREVIKVLTEEGLIDKDTFSVALSVEHVKPERAEPVGGDTNAV